VRTAKEARRRNARQRAREGRFMDVSRVEPAPVEDQADVLPLLDEELNRLPPRYRAALVAFELEGRSRHEAALHLGLPEGTLSTHLARGRKLLRERLRRRGVSFGTGPLAGLARPFADTTVSERLAGSTVRAALGYAAGESSAGPVTALVERVLKLMLVTRLAVLIGAVVAFGLAAAVTGAAVFKEPAKGPEAPVQAVAKPDPGAEKAQAEQAKAVPGRVRVHGVVVDEAGNPLPGIDVRANSVDDRQSRGVTDASGHFDFLVRGSELQGASLLAASNDHARQGMYRYRYWLAREDPAQPVRVVCKPARAVAVRVNDRGGKPVADASVAFLAEKNPVDEGRTDADGRWTARVPADERDWTVIARKAKVGFDYEFAGYPGKPQEMKPLPDQLTLTLDGSRTVRV
jgi:hypothetical protein